MADHYKADIIQKHLEKMEEDGYYIVRLKGDSGNAVNLDQGALRLLKAYYGGAGLHDGQAPCQ